jgi:hypothetical protein
MKDSGNLLLLAGAAALAYYLYSSQTPPQYPGIPIYSTTPTPLGIYPSLSWLQQTAMAATPNQRASTAEVLPQSLFTATQMANRNSLLSQCAGSWPTCTPMAGDTFLGL